MFSHHLHFSPHKMKSSLKYYILLFCLNIIEGSFRCDYQYNPKAKTWFKTFYIPANWFDARLRCSLEGAVLASPITPEIVTVMKSIINDTDPEVAIFTGFHATFSQGDYYSIEGTSLRRFHLPWVKNEPDNKNNTESCITFNGRGELKDSSCEETRPYICYHNETFQEVDNKCGTVDPEYQLDTRTEKCYKFHTVPRNFARAFLACSAEGGHLAIINSEIEATVLRELFAKYPATSLSGNFFKDVALIGVNNWGESWDWRTIHGQTLTEAGYSTFSQGEPNIATPGQYCLGILRTGLLDDVKCSGIFTFVCEKSPSLPGVCPPRNT